MPQQGWKIMLCYFILLLFLFFVCFCSSILLHVIFILWQGYLPSLGFPCGSAGKESTCNAGDLGSILELGRSPEEGKDYPLQYSGLEKSMDCIVHGVAKSWAQLSDFHFTLSIIYLKKWETKSMKVKRGIHTYIHTYIYIYIYSHKYKISKKKKKKALCRWFQKYLKARVLERDALVPCLETDFSRLHDVDKWEDLSRLDSSSLK